MKKRDVVKCSLAFMLSVSLLMGMVPTSFAASLELSGDEGEAETSAETESEYEAVTEESDTSEPKSGKVETEESGMDEMDTVQTEETVTVEANEEDVQAVSGDSTEIAWPLSLSAKADAFTHSLNGGTNYGSSTTLRMRNNNKYYAHIYEKYDLADAISSDGYLIGSIGYLMTISTEVSEDTTVHIGYLSDSSWEEDGITYNNYTDSHSAQDVTTVTVPDATAVGETIEADLSDLISIMDWSDTLLTLELYNDYGGSENLFIYSKESDAGGAQLQIHYETSYTAETSLLEASIGERVSFTVPATDTAGEAVTLEVVYAPESSSFDEATGTFSWEPEEAVLETLVLRVTKDGEALGYYVRHIQVSYSDEAKIFSVGADTFTHSLNGGTNYGTSTTLRMRNNNKYYAHVYEKYELAELSELINENGSLIESIVYQMTLSSSVDTDTTVQVGYLTDNDWEETEATYNNFTSGQTAETLTSVIIAAGSSAGTAVTADLSTLLWTKDWSDPLLTLDLFNEYGGQENIFLYSRESDNGGSVLTVTYNLDYIAENTALEVEAGETVSFTIPVTDVSSDAISLEVIYMPDGASFDTDTGVFSWETEAETNEKMVLLVTRDGEILGYYVREILVNAAEEVTVFSAEADTFTHSLNGGTNYGTSTTLRMRNNNKYYAHIYERYDLADLVSESGALLAGITYQMNLSSGLDADGTVEIGYLEDNDWEETEITYNNFTSSHTAEELATVVIPSGSVGNSAVTADLTAILWTKYWSDPLLTLDLFNEYGGQENIFIYSRESSVGGSSLTVTYNSAYTSDNETIQADYNEEISFTLSTTDDSGSAVTLTAVNLPEGASFDSDTGAFRWTATSTGTNLVVIEVCEGEEVLGYYVRYLEIAETRPVFSVTMGGEALEETSITIRAGEKLSLNVTAVTPDGEMAEATLTVEESIPGGLTYDTCTGDLTWTPDAGQEGTYVLTWSAENNGVPSEYTLTVIVIGRYEESRIIYAEADTYINSNSGSTSKNYGADTVLVLRGGYKWAYLRFSLEDLASVNGFITDISLRLTTSDVSTDSNGDAAIVTTTPILLTEDGWSEGTLVNTVIETGSNAVTYDTMPSYYSESTYLNSMYSTMAEETLYSSVTENVLSEYLLDGKISFCLRNIVSKNNAAFYSKENGEEDKSPALVITKDCNYDVPEDVTILQGETLTVNIPQTKGDGTALTLSINELPSNASFDESTGVLTWTPDGSQYGDYAIYWSASYEDENGDTVWGYFTFTITVEENEDLWGVGGPQESYTISEGDTLTLTPYLEPVSINEAAEAVRKDYYEITLSASATAEDLQLAIDNASAAGGGIVTLEAGTYLLDACIEVKSNVTIQGSGMGVTVLQKAKDVSISVGFLYSEGGVSDVIIKDLTIDTNTVDTMEDNSNYGILITDTNSQKNYRILLESVEITNAGMGLQTKGTYDLVVRDCSFHDNGWGPEAYYHNVYIRRTYRALFENCVFYNAKGGNGMNITACEDIKIVNCDAYANYWRGYKAANTQRIGFYNCTATGSSCQDGFILAVEDGGVSNYAFVNCVSSDNGRNGFYLVYGYNGYVINCIGENNADGFYSENTGTGAQIDENVSVTWTAKNQPDGADLNEQTGELVWETGFDDSGTYSFTLKAEVSGDMIGSVEAVRDVFVTVTDVTDPYFEKTEMQLAYVNKKCSVTVSAVDPEGSTLTLSAKGMPDGMSVTDNEDNTLTLAWTPQSYQTGTFYVTLLAVSPDESRQGETTLCIYVTDPETTVYDRETAEALLEEAVIGYNNGEYSHYAMSLLQEAVRDNELTDDEINKTVQSFLALVVTEETGDVDGDGSHTTTDLEQIVSHYGEETENYDADGDGVIRLEDMVYTAKRINGDYSSVRQLTLEADGGSYITKSAPGSAYHVERVLNTAEGAFVTFDLSDTVLPGSIVEAVLVMYTVDDSETHEISIAVMNDDHSVCNWDGTYTALYAASYTSIGTGKTEDGVLSVNVTAAMLAEKNNDGRITFRLQNTDGNALYFASDNVSDRSQVPALVVRTRMSEGDCDSYDALLTDVNSLNLENATAVTENLNLVETGENGTSFTWMSFDTDYLQDDGTITRPGYYTMDMPVELTMTAVCGNVTMERTYTVTVAKEESPSDMTASPALAEVEIDEEVTELVETYWEDSAFTYVDYPTQYLDYMVTVTEKTGDAIAEAIAEVNAAGGGVVQLEAGIYVVDKAIQMMSNVTLVGMGRTETILMQAEEWVDFSNTMLISFNNSGGVTQITDVVIKDLSLYGIKTDSSDVSGIYGNGDDSARHDRLMVQNISIRHFSGIGFEIKRANNIIMDSSSFTDNGSSNSLYHNVYFLYNKNILQSNLDMSRPVTGKSCKYTSTTNVIAQHIVMRDGTGNAVQADNTGAEYILFHDYTIDNYDGYGLWFPCEDYMDKYTYKEDPTYAPQHVILSRVSVTNTKTGGIWRIVLDSYAINCYFNNRRDNLQLLKCEVTFINTVFEGPDDGPTYYESKDDLPDPVL